MDSIDWLRPLLTPSQHEVVVDNLEFIEKIAPEVVTELLNTIEGQLDDIAVSDLATLFYENILGIHISLFKEYSIHFNLETMLTSDLNVILRLHKALLVISSGDYGDEVDLSVLASNDEITTTEEFLIAGCALVDTDIDTLRLSELLRTVPDSIRTIFVKDESDESEPVTQLTLPQMQHIKNFISTYEGNDPIKNHLNDGGALGNPFSQYVELYKPSLYLNGTVSDYAKRICLLALYSGYTPQVIKANASTIVTTLFPEDDGQINKISQLVQELMSGLEKKVISDE